MKGRSFSIRDFDEMVSERIETLRGARCQSGTAALLLLVIAATATGLDLLARDERLFDWVDSFQKERFRNELRTYRYTHYFIDAGDRLLLDELPVADYSRGGVYFIGASNLMVASEFRELPSDQAQLIHNYGIASSTHATQFQLVRFLIEANGLLQAGPQKTFIVFGVSFHSAGSLYGPDAYVPNLLIRHGLYCYDEAHNMQIAGPTGTRRWLRIEKVRIAGFIRTCGQELTEAFAKHVLRIESKRRVHNPVKYNTHVRDLIMGPEWEDLMRTEVSQFGRALDYLRDRHVRVAVVLLPLGSWDDNLPFRSRYNAAMAEVCGARHVSLYDWSGILDDEKFGDYGHLNPEGTSEMTRRFLDIALPFLRETGALP
jgi:hypothetical protein